MMRLFISILFFVLCVSTGFSQVTIGQAEMPDKNTNTLYSYAETNTQIDHTLAGNNQTWDYSSLTYALQLEKEYKSAGSINVLFFGIRNGFGTKVLDSLGAGQFKFKDIYDVFKTTSKKMTAEGRSIKYNGIPIPVFYEDKDEVYQYPMTFGRKDSSTFKARFSVANQFSLVQSGTRVNTVEGEGSLTTPYKTYPKCLKLKTVVSGVDSVKINILPAIPIPRNSVEYQWFVPGEVGPVLVVQGIEVLGRFTVQEIRFQDEPVSLIGFEADNNYPTVNQKVTLNDTSTVQAFIRTWTITPNTHNYVNNTSSSSTTPEVEFTAVGSYAVKLAVRNRFGQMEEERTNYIHVLKEPVSVNQSSLMQQGIVAYPNPCTDLIKLTGNDVSILKVLNSNGQQVNAHVSGQSIDVSDLKTGNYWIIYTNTEGAEGRLPFVKR